MLEDFRTFADGTELDADICIIGGGAAGITIARELASTPLRVCLLESGGLDFDPDTQALYAGSSIGTSPYVDPDTNRLRYFGGSTNHWEGRCAPFQASDFECRPWVPYSGWPITRADLDPFYEKAQSICGLGPYVYDDDKVWQKLGVPTPDFNRDLLETQFFQVSAPARIVDEPTRFGTAYRDAIASAGNIQGLLNANVTNIQSSENGAEILHVDVRTLDGKRGRVRARTFILACGGLENPRLLLASNTVEPAGLGNRHDVVGRFFMDHGIADFAVVLPTDTYGLLDRFGYFSHSDGIFRSALRLGAGAAERDQALNSLGVMYYVSDMQSGAAAAKTIWNDLKQGRYSNALGDKIWRVATDLDDVAYGVYRDFVLKRNAIIAPKRIFLESENEQAPNPDSRVMLGTEKDALGMPRIAVDWRLTEQDHRTVAVFAETIAREFGRLNLGRLQLEPWVLDAGQDWRSNIRGNVHPSGTTRMADDPKVGVVDRNCRVHGVQNLYVAGATVFPTTGTVNPTLTIVALALRLADHLQATLA